ncbi:MAG: phytanoyl-CoA dioxygenase family protein [Lewinellaceae bacterium]|nr:phytanoyl-CoA dioxygenase family protein [Lewinellaceae bacterium]
MLQRFFEKYTGFLRSWKPVYVVNNLLNRDKLRHNKSLYRQYGLQKSLYSPLGSSDFPEHHPDIPWLDQPNPLPRLEAHPEFQALPADFQHCARQFVADGFCVLKNYFPEHLTSALNDDMDARLRTGKAGFNYTGRKIFNLHESSPLANEQFLRQPELLHFLSFLLGKNVIPFQTLGFIQGSEQRAHSDSIHMTTEPQGYLIATWIALEDTSPDNGPLFYFPGSHRLPYVMSGDYPSGNTAWTIGEESNRRFEDRIEQLIQEHQLQPQPFLAKRGDVLVWHANLLHGGSPIRKEGSTRRSLVCHYFAEGVICYHEMSQRPALIPPATGNR